MPKIYLQQPCKCAGYSFHANADCELIKTSFSLSEMISDAEIAVNKGKIFKPDASHDRERSGSKAGPQFHVIA